MTITAISGDGSKSLPITGHISEKPVVGEESSARGGGDGFSSVKSPSEALDQIAARGRRGRVTGSREMIQELPPIGLAPGQSSRRAVMDIEYTRTDGTHGSTRAVVSISRARPNANTDSISNVTPLMTQGGFVQYPGADNQYYFLSVSTAAYDSPGTLLARDLAQGNITIDGFRVVSAD